MREHAFIKARGVFLRARKVSRAMLQVAILRSLEEYIISDSLVLDCSPAKSLCKSEQGGLLQVVEAQCNIDNHIHKEDDNMGHVTSYL